MGGVTPLAGILNYANEENRAAWSISHSDSDCGLNVMAASSSCLDLPAVIHCTPQLWAEISPLPTKLLHFCLGLWALGYRYELPCLILLACFCFCSHCSIAVLSISLCCCTLYCWVAIFIYVYLNLFVHSHMNGLCVQFGLLLNCQFKDANKNAIFIVA